MAALVNIVGAKGQVDSATTLTTAAVTPSGSDTAVLVFTLGEATGYCTESRYNTSGGTLIDDFTSADIFLSIASGLALAYGKVFGQVASPTSSTAIYSSFPTAGNSVVVASIFLEDVDQTTPFGTEQVSSATILGGGTETISRSFTGLVEDDLVIGCLFVHDFAGSASTVTVNTGTTLEDSIVNTGPENDFTSLYIVSGIVDSGGNCTLSTEVTLNAVHGMARMWGIPVNGVAGGGLDVTLSISGGVTFSGTSPFNLTRVQAVSGGVSFSGTAPFTRSRIIAPSGGVSFGGSATMGHSRELSVSGGVTFGGSAPISFAGNGGIETPSKQRMVGMGTLT